MCVSWRRREEKYVEHSPLIATPRPQRTFGGCFYWPKKREIHPLLLELVLERWLYWRVIEDVCAEHPLWMGTVKHYRKIYNLAPLKLILTHQKL